MRARVLAPVAAAFLAACMSVVSIPAPAPGGGGAPPAAGAGPGAAREAAGLANEHRRRAGCPPLAWDDAGARAAQLHSDDMARRDYFSHTSPEGVGMVERLRAQGIQPRMAAENIARGPATAHDAVRGWLNSAGHRQNIENCAYTRHGVGERSGRWTHVFFTP
jgi:uncharacterized protein YkwD